MEFAVVVCESCVSAAMEHVSHSVVLIFIHSCWNSFVGLVYMFVCADSVL